MVGPRPPLPREVLQYNGDVKRRLLVKPGVTGLWQVNGRSDLPWDESVRLDLSYVDNWSMASDFLLIAKTLKAVVSSDGAYNDIVSASRWHACSMIAFPDAAEAVYTGRRQHFSHMASMMTGPVNRPTTASLPRKQLIA